MCCRSQADWQVAAPQAEWRSEQPTDGSSVAGSPDSCRASQGTTLSRAPQRTTGRRGRHAVPQRSTAAPTTGSAPRLPKLRVQTPPSGAGHRALLWSTIQGNVAGTGGGAARHTRAWSVDAPAAVAGCRRLRFVPHPCKMQGSAMVNAGVPRSSSRPLPRPKKSQLSTQSPSLSPEAGVALRQGRRRHDHRNRRQ